MWGSASVPATAQSAPTSQPRGTLYCQLHHQKRGKEERRRARGGGGSRGRKPSQHFPELGPKTSRLGLGTVRGPVSSHPHPSGHRHLLRTAGFHLRLSLEIKCTLPSWTLLALDLLPMTSLQAWDTLVSRPRTRTPGPTPGPRPQLPDPPLRRRSWAAAERAA